MSPPTARVFPAVPLPFSGGRILPSPAQFYLTGEDRLRIVSACSLTGTAVQIRARLADFTGDTKAEGWVHIPNTDRTVRTEDYELGDGSLLNVTVFASGSAPRIGQAYVMIQLVRGSGPGAFVLATLLGGYITATQALGFPGSPIFTSDQGGGYLRAVIGTTPAAGAEPVEVVPTGARWELQGIQVSLTTSVAAGNRETGLRMRPGTIGTGTYMTTIVQPPSTTFTYSIGPGLPVLLDALGVQAMLPAIFSPVLIAGETFLIRCAGMQAGDQFTAPQYAVREFLEV